MPAIRPLARGTCAIALLLGGCAGAQSALDPAGIQALRIERLTWVFVAVCGVVFVAVLVALTLAIRRERGTPEPPETPPHEVEHRMEVRVGVAVGLTVLVLIGLLIADFVTRRGLRAIAHREALGIRVTGHQWWWDFEYDDLHPSHHVVSPNEIHLPAGRVVRFDLQSADVIHSFWIPNLHGKKDLIPGHPAVTYLRADRPGIYFGQCAEFCGHQHATMRFVVVVESEADFQRWLAAQREPGRAPLTASVARGQQVFTQGTCAMCHTVAGTNAAGRVGPDLTHVASRLRLAAGTLPNTRGHLAGWISDPQRIRPGVRMPPNAFAPGDLRALLDYLGTLK